MNYSKYIKLAAAIIVGDQVTKFAVRAYMQPGDRISILGDWLSLYYVRNTGTAFSMFAGNTFITVVLTTALIIGCIVYIAYELRKGSRFIPLLLTMVAAGGVSNLFDRLFRGYVTDMISCKTFAVFNVADIFVTCGCFLLIIYLAWQMREEEKAAERRKKEALMEAVRISGESAEDDHGEDPSDAESETELSAEAEPGEETPDTDI